MLDALDDEVELDLRAGPSRGALHRDAITELEAEDDAAAADAPKGGDE